MEEYTKLCKELIEAHISETQDPTKTRTKVLTDLRDDTENVFGNIDGSRTYSTYDAQRFIDFSDAIWDSEILDLFSDISEDYFFTTLKQGAETFDVVILELIAPQIIDELLEKENKQ
jgi:hypothetical protein